MRPASTATSRLRSSLTKVPDLKKIAAFSRTEAVRDSRPPFFLYPALLCCKILTVICGVEKMDARKKLSDVLGELNRVTGLSLRADEVPEEDNGTYHLLWMSDRLRIAREVDMRLVRIHAELVLMERYLRHSQSILDYLATPFLDAYRQGMRGAMSNESYRRWRQSSIDALHSDRLDSIHQRRKPSQAPVRRADVSSAALPPKETKPVEMNTPHEN